MRRFASLALSVLVFLVGSTAEAKPWRFVVGGDGRSDPKANRPEDKNGINTLITGEIAQAAIAEKARFLMWTGDLVYGYCKDDAEFETQLMTWRGIMQPVYDAGIKVLPCRGNHDAGSVHSDAVWRKVFSGKYAVPNNGPDSEKDVSFFHIHETVLAIGLDQYTVGKELVNQGWLDKVLADHKRPFIFAMGHEPAFMDGAHKDTMDASPADRDRFWNSLIAAGARVFFCGHDHLYDHMSVVREGANPGVEMHQFVAGTSGAPFYKPGEYAGKNDGWKLTRVKNIPNTYGYLVVEIDGDKATVTFKGRTAPGKYEAMDSWSYTVPKK